MSATYAIRIEKLFKNYGGRPVLRGVEFNVEQGKTVFVLGDNGSGKTSLLKIASSLSAPTSGRVAVSGLDTVRFAKKVRRKVGFVSHENCLYEELGAFDNLRFFCSLQEVSDPTRRARELMDVFEIDPSPVCCGMLSEGMKKRVSIARAVSHRPDVLILDEPFSGLDRRGAAIFRDFLAGLKRKGTTALISTHLESYAEEMSDRAVFLCGGRIGFCEDAPSLPALEQKMLERSAG